MRRFPLFILSLLATAQPTLAETVTLSPTVLTEWKAVYGRIESRDRVPARARIGGTVTELAVSEGDMVTSGQTIATVVDDKLSFRLDANAAQRETVAAQLANAEKELDRGEALLKQGVTTVQRLDVLRTQVEVLRGQISSIDAEAEVIRQSQTEGKVLAPASGRILDVPVPQGAVVMPGEALATLSVGGTFLRLAIPERHAAMLVEGRTISIETADGPREGRLAKVYPLVENGRLIADVEVEGLSDRLVDARILVRLPLAERTALLVPQSALFSRSGLDFVQVETATGTKSRVVVPGGRADGGLVEILSGLQSGDLVVTDPAEVGHD